MTDLREQALALRAEMASGHMWLPQQAAANLATIDALIAEREELQRKFSDAQAVIAGMSELPSKVERATAQRCAEIGDAEAKLWARSNDFAEQTARRIAKSIAAEFKLGKGK